MISHLKLIASVVSLSLLLLICAPCNYSYALTIDEPLPDRIEEQRAKELFYDIRCVVCAGEAIADSPAEVARDMRHNVREMIAAGKSDSEIKEELVGKYGDYILMKPPLKSGTLVLWLAPWAMLLLAIAWFVVSLYRKSRTIK